MWYLWIPYYYCSGEAQWIHDSDSAIIMVDLADRASIENVVYWYSMFSQFHMHHIYIWLWAHGLLISNLIGEILSSQKHSDKSTSLPVLIYSCKVYEKGDKRAIDPTEIPWSDELGNTPFFYNQYQYFYGPDANRIQADRSETRPLRWILEQLSGHPKVVCGSNLFTPCYYYIAAAYLPLS
jgi:hypothetical protein